MCSSCVLRSPRLVLHVPTHSISQYPSRSLIPSLSPSLPPHTPYPLFPASQAMTARLDLQRSLHDRIAKQTSQMAVLLAERDDLKRQTAVHAKSAAIAQVRTLTHHHSRGVWGEVLRRGAGSVGEVSVWKPPRLAAVPKHEYGRATITMKSHGGLGKRVLEKGFHQRAGVVVVAPDTHTTPHQLPFHTLNGRRGRGGRLLRQPREEGEKEVKR